MSFDMLITTPQVVSIALGAALVTVPDFRVVLAAIGVVVAVAAGYLWPGRVLTPPTPSAAPRWTRRRSRSWVSRPRWRRAAA